MKAERLAFPLPLFAGFKIGFRPNWIGYFFFVLGLSDLGLGSSPTSFSYILHNPRTVHLKLKRENQEIEKDVHQFDLPKIYNLSYVHDMTSDNITLNFNPTLTNSTKLG